MVSESLKTNTTLTNLNLFRDEKMKNNEMNKKKIRKNEMNTIKDR